ncbi:hypothetical protein BGX38DRAFT_689715 [Terfezia claveryi]|nr:hypothetical protein BGX38DRAFT_689715 [Terfezia claveryi]
MNNHDDHEALLSQPQLEPQPQRQLQPQGLPSPAHILAEAETFASTQHPDRILARIHTLPRLRPLEFSVEPLPGKPINFDSQINQNAVLTYSRGREIVGANACIKCAAGKGTFQKCVMLEGFSKGSCANCVINSYGHRCSFRNIRMYTFRCLTSQRWIRESDRQFVG